jgi:hypothetical protein
MTLSTFTIDDIRKLNPCYDPARYLPEDWIGTALDVLRVTACPVEDRFWVVFHEGWIDDRALRLFAVWCARQAMALIGNPDPRSITACDVAERFANGEATSEELAAARVAAGEAAWVAAWVAAGEAAREAAREAAWVAQINHLIEMLEEIQ